MTDMINLDAASPSEIERIVLAHAGAAGHYEDWSWWRDERDGDRPEEIADLGTVTVVDTVGGSEGDGESQFVVIKVAQGETVRYFKKEGYYSSYGGSDWDGEIRSVWPSQKTITVYE